MVLILGGGLGRSWAVMCSLCAAETSWSNYRTVREVRWSCFKMAAEHGGTMWIRIQSLKIQMDRIWTRSDWTRRIMREYIRKKRWAAKSKDRRSCWGRQSGVIAVEVDRHGVDSWRVRSKLPAWSNRVRLGSIREAGLSEFKQVKRGTEDEHGIWQMRYAFGWEHSGTWGLKSILQVSQCIWLEELGGTMVGNDLFCCLMYFPYFSQHIFLYSQLIHENWIGYWIGLFPMVKARYLILSGIVDRLLLISLLYLIRHYRT